MPEPGNLPFNRRENGWRSERALRLSADVLILLQQLIAVFAHAVKLVMHHRQQPPLLRQGCDASLDPLPEAPLQITECRGAILSLARSARIAASVPFLTEPLRFFVRLRLILVGTSYLRGFVLNAR